LFVIAVALVVLAGLVLWLLRRMQVKGAWPGASRRIQVLETRALGPRHRLVLVRVGGREWLLGVSPSEIRAVDGWRSQEGPSDDAAAEDRVQTPAGGARA
jgi:flagellar protein FliO/FliZ